MTNKQLPVHVNTLGQLTRSINTIFNDPSWTKAVFYREPLGRFLSGWLDKCDDISRVYCVHVFGGTNVSFRDAALSLAHGCNHAPSLRYVPLHQHLFGSGVEGPTTATTLMTSATMSWLAQP